MLPSSLVLPSSQILLLLLESSLLRSSGPLGPFPPSLYIPPPNWIPGFSRNSGTPDRTLPPPKQKKNRRETVHDRAPNHDGGKGTQTDKAQASTGKEWTATATGRKYGRHPRSCWYEVRAPEYLDAGVIRIRHKAPEIRAHHPNMLARHTSHLSRHAQTAQEQIGDPRNRTTLRPRHRRLLVPSAGALVAGSRRLLTRCGSAQCCVERR